MGQTMSRPFEPTAGKPGLQLAAAIAVALITVAGVLLYDWPVFVVMVLYWAENVFIGITNVARLLVAGSRRGAAGLLGSLFTAAFFTVHYGLFASVHGAFVFALFGPRQGAGAGPVDDRALADLAAVVTVDGWLLLAVVAVAAAVAVDTVRWIAGSRERPEGNDLGRLMVAPYGRVVVLHLTLIFGAGLMALLKAPAAAALLLAGLKLAFDLLRLRGGPGAAAPAGAGVPLRAARLRWKR
jgi:hypothetical protein